MGPLGSILRAPLVLAALISAQAGSWWWFAPERSAARQPDADLAALLVGLAIVMLHLVLVWLTLVVALLAIEPLLGRPLTGWVGCPIGVRRLLLGLCGLATLSALAAPVQAADAPDHHRESSPPSSRIAGLPLPDRAEDPRDPTPSPRQTSSRREVRPGDSLWRIARRSLPARSTTTAIARRTGALYDANRTTIGPDPDLIRPGQRLELPITRPQEDA